MDLKQIKDIIEANELRTIILIGTDSCNVQRGKRVPAPYFLKIAESGVNFASYILYTTMMDEVLPGLFDTGIPDVRGAPDLSTFRVAPWEPHTGVVIMDWTRPDGSAHPLCLRSELKRQIANVRALGLEELMSIEFEFYLLPYSVHDIRGGKWSNHAPAQKDVHCYSLYEGNFYEPVVAEIRECFPDEIEGCSPEWGQGQVEINLHRSDALTMCDTAILFKTAVKQLAVKHGHTATFMAKWHEDYSGSSGHIHQSLIDLKSRKAAFYDEGRAHRMSELAEHYVAGQLDLFRPLTLFFAPVTNSYKRFQPDSFAGFVATWGIDNRTVSLRVINSSPGKMRVENRIGGADLNPYIAFAASLGAGLRGAARKLSLPAASEGNSYNQRDVASVPRTLNEAIEAVRNSSSIKEVIAPAIVDNLIRIASYEDVTVRAKVTDVERRRYLEMA
jgi:glutamine synthetase